MPIWAALGFACFAGLCSALLQLYSAKVCWARPALLCIAPFHCTAFGFASLRSVWLGAALLHRAPLGFACFASLCSIRRY